MSVLGPLLALRLKEDPNAFVLCILEFILTRVTITSEFTGTNPAGAVVTTLSVNNIDSLLLNGMIITGAAGFESWALSIYSAIKSSCYISTPVNPVTGVIVSSPVLAFPELIYPSWTLPQLLSAQLNSSENPLMAVMEVIGSGIETDLKTAMNKLPWASTFPTASATGESTNIKLNIN